jgi:hypothetical protein
MQSEYCLLLLTMTVSVSETSPRLAHRYRFTIFQSKMYFMMVSYRVLLHRVLLYRMFLYRILLSWLSETCETTSTNVILF